VLCGLLRVRGGLLLDGRTVKWRGHARLCMHAWRKKQSYGDKIAEQKEVDFRF
jgi:hypothetical protein